MSARALARDYQYRVLDPIMTPAIQYVRLQKPSPARCLPSLLNYLRAKQEGEELEPDRSKLKADYVPIPDAATSVIVKVLAEIVGQAPPAEEALGKLIEVFEREARS